MLSLTRAVAALLVIAPFVAAHSQAPAPQKVVAYVDSRYILNNAPAAPAAQAVLQRDGQGLQAQVQRMSDSLDAMTTAFTRDQAGLTPEKRDAAIKAINDRQGEYQVRVAGLQQQAEAREAEVMQPILDQIKLAIEDVRAELGYAMILDAGQSATIVAADKNLNISDRVIARLRTMPVPVIAEQSAGAAKADPKAAGKATPPTGGPVSAPAGIRPPGSGPPPAGKSDTKKADSTSKRPDSTGKRPHTR